MDTSEKQVELIELNTGDKELNTGDKVSPREENDQSSRFQEMRQMLEEQSLGVKEIKQIFDEWTRKSEGKPPVQTEQYFKYTYERLILKEWTQKSEGRPPVLTEPSSLFKDQLQREHEKLKEDYEKLKEDYEKLKKEMDERWAQFQNDWQESFLYPDWRKNFFEAANVILDPLTAHRNLSLSEDGRCVTWEEKQHDLPDNPQRFHSLPCVLGQLSITKGKYYWEVEVGNCGFWDLGICRDIVTKKGRVAVQPKDGFWVIRFYNDEYWALTSPQTKLNPKKQPTRVCIFLEYEDKRISFYNMTDNSHIYTFSQCSFQGFLRPLFRLWSSDSRLLIIYPGQ